MPAGVPSLSLPPSREPGRPLFVSMLLYLNEAWPEDYHSETLLLDPESQTGLAVRPFPGRVLLMVWTCKLCHPRRFYPSYHDRF